MAGILDLAGNVPATGVLSPLTMPVPQGVRVDPVTGIPQGTTGPVAPPRTGFGGAVDRFLRPSSGLGQFADYLLAATGSPIGGALMAMRQQEQETADRDLNRRYKEATIERMAQP